MSVVVCSIDPLKLAKFRSSLERSVDGPFELIAIHDARSLCEGYARGLARSRGEIVVLCHDDIEFLVDDLHGRLAHHLSRFSLIGPCGTRILSGAAWIWGGPAVNEGWIVHALPKGTFAGCVYGAHGSPVAGAQALDGVLLAGRRGQLLELGFDAATFDGFHCYDLDLSYRAHCAGLAIGIAGDLLVSHSSDGKFNAEYARFARRFLEKFPELPLGPYHPEPNLAVVEMADRAMSTRSFAWLASWHRRHE